MFSAFLCWGPEPSVSSPNRLSCVFLPEFARVAVVARRYAKPIGDRKNNTRTRSIVTAAARDWYKTDTVLGGWREAFGCGQTWHYGQHASRMRIRLRLFGEIATTTCPRDPRLPSAPKQVFDTTMDGDDQTNTVQTARQQHLTINRQNSCCRHEGRATQHVVSQRNDGRRHGSPTQTASCGPTYSKQGVPSVVFTAHASWLQPTHVHRHRPHAFPNGV